MLGIAIREESNEQVHTSNFMEIEILQKLEFRTQLICLCGYLFFFWQGNKHHSIPLFANFWKYMWEPIFAMETLPNRDNEAFSQATCAGPAA